MSETILVVGATGTVGRGIVRSLKTFGIPIRAATRLPIPYAVAHPDLEVVLFDYRDPGTFKPAVRGVSKAFVVPHQSDPHPQKSVIPLIEAAREAGVMHIVLMTHCDVEAYPPSGLLEIEKFLISSGLVYTILRPNWLMQIFNPGFLWPAIRKTDSIFLPVQDARTSFVNAEDVAAVATVALTEEGHLDQTYTLTGCEALSYSEVAQIISNAGARKIRFLPMSNDDFYQTMIKTEMDPLQVNSLINRFSVVRRGCTAQVTEDVSRLLGRPPVKFLDFAYDHSRIWGSQR